MSVNFNRDEEGIKTLAIFLIELVRKGVTYKIDNSELHVKVTLAGGF